MKQEKGENKEQALVQPAPTVKPDDKTVLKNEIIKVKSQLTNVNALSINCERIKTNKRIIITEDIPGKDPKELASFSLSGEMVVDIMEIVNNLVESSKNKILDQQSKLIDELNKFI